MTYSKRDVSIRIKGLLTRRDRLQNEGSFSRPYGAPSASKSLARFVEPSIPEPVNGNRTHGIEIHCLI